MASAADIDKIIDKYAWYVERGQCAVIERGASGGWVSITEILPVRMVCTKTADPLTGTSDGVHDHLSEEPELPAQFHMGIVYKAISELYRTPDSLNLELAQAFELEYMKSVRRGKKYSRRGHISTGRIIGVDF